MSIMEWNNSLSVNILKIDNQHKKLIGILNNLFDSMKTGQSKDILGKILFDLIDYTKVHFQTEETYFSKYNYPKASEHIKEHNALIEKVTELKEKYNQGSLIISRELLHFLLDWVQNHILESDKQYSTYLNQQGLY